MVRVLKTQSVQSIGYILEEVQKFTEIKTQMEKIVTYIFIVTIVVKKLI